MDKSFHLTLYWARDDLSILVLKLIHATNGTPVERISSS